MCASDAPKYRKRLDDQPPACAPPRAPDVTGPVVLRVSLGDMDLRDAFHVTLPAGCARLTVGGLLDTVFGEDDTARQQTLGALDVAGNPDLPDMYLELLDVARLWRTGRCELRIYANNGPRVEPGHPAEDFLGHSPDGAAVLDLVLEQTFEPLAWFARQGGDCEELLRWMRACVLLYFMDKHAFELSPRPDGERDRRLLPIAEELCGRGFVTLPAAAGAFAITEEGRAYLGELIAETEDYVDRYGVFGSVRVDEEAEIADFDARGGLDLRAQVYEDEGLDPLRVVFLLRLYDGALDESLARWREDIHEVSFYDGLLRPALDRDEVDATALDWVIDAGLAQVEEAAERDRERLAAQDALRRALD